MHAKHLAKVSPAFTSKVFVFGDASAGENARAKENDCNESKWPYFNA